VDRPRVLIVGGFVTVPLNYWPMRRRLLARGAAAVDIAQIWPPDWALASVVGLGPVMRRTKRAVLQSYRAAGDQPIIVVGHSGGGIAARLAMSAVPFHGEKGGVAEAVGCLVTLGTPHGLAALTTRYHHAGHDAAEFLDRTSPRAFFAPRTAYLSVGSDYERAAVEGPIGWAASQVFSAIVGNDGVRGGDGIVPFSAVHLDGAKQLTFRDARHGHIGSNWYGANAIVDRWWPEAVRLWRSALEIRNANGGLTSSTPNP